MLEYYEAISWFLGQPHRNGFAPIVRVASFKLGRGISSRQIGCSPPFSHTNQSSLPHSRRGEAPIKIHCMERVVGRGGGGIAEEFDIENEKKSRISATSF